MNLTKEELYEIIHSCTMNNSMGAKVLYTGEDYLVNRIMEAEEKKKNVSKNAHLWWGGTD